jgi:5'-nucleotidase
MILVTNDDGVDSEGLLALKQALSKIDTVAVIAPNRNWTASGHTKTLDRPLRIAEVKLADGSSAYSSDGTPSDCVSLAFLGFLKERPRMVVSGINKGPNLGSDVTYSGTVSAAMEGVVSGVPSLAVSLADYYQWDFSFAAEFTARLVARLLREEGAIPRELLLNVNVPNVPASEIRGVEITRLGRREYRDQLIRRQDPFGRPYYWIGGEVPAGTLEPGTDLHAVAENRVSITPILMDLTNVRLMNQLCALLGPEFERLPVQCGS